MNDVYIASGARTPMGGFQGSLSDLGAVDLGAAAIKEAVSRANLDGSDIEEIIIGCVLPSGLRQGPLGRRQLMQAFLWNPAQRR